MTGGAATLTQAHEARVEVVVGRYPYKPTCSCGWSTWGYVADHAAQILVDAHLEEVRS